MSLSLKENNVPLTERKEMKSIAGSILTFTGYAAPSMMEASPLLENLSFITSIMTGAFTIYQIIKSTRKRNGSDKRQ